MATKTTNTAPLRFIDASILFLNPENPRSDMGDLSELVASIQAHGILQPLLVRQVDGAYMVIDGSCRLAAGLQAGLTTFPCHEVPEAEELPEEEEPAPAFVPGWVKRKKQADAMSEALAARDWDHVDAAKLLVFLAESYRGNGVRTSNLDKLKESTGASVIDASLNEIKSAVLADIVYEFFASEEFGDDTEAVGYWEQFKDAFGISEEEVHP